METVESAGAHWRDRASPDFKYPAFTVSGVDVEGVSLAAHYIAFPDGGRMKIEFEAMPDPATGEWNYRSYSYNYLAPTGFVFRFDNHPEQWFEKKYGTTCHVHYGHKQKDPTEAIELDAAVDEAVTYVNTHTFSASPYLLGTSASTSSTSKYRV